MDAAAKIVLSCDLIDSVWTQVDDLANSLIKLTEMATQNNDFGDLKSAGKLYKSYQHSKSGWLTSAYQLSFPLMEKKRRKSVATAWVNYQISICGSGIAPYADQEKSRKNAGPMLHVSFWLTQLDFTEAGMFVEFPARWEEQATDSQRLIYWDVDRPTERKQWTFSVRLLEMQNEEVLRRSVIEPISRLLRGEATSIALPETTVGLVFYAEEDRGDGMKTPVAIER